MYDTLGEYDSQEIAQDCYNRFSPSVISDKLVDVFQKAVEKRKNVMKNLIIIAAGGMGRTLYDMARESLGFATEFVIKGLLMIICPH